MAPAAQGGFASFLPTPFKSLQIGFEAAQRLIVTAPYDFFGWSPADQGSGDGNPAVGGCDEVNAFRKCKQVSHEICAGRVAEGSVGKSCEGVSEDFDAGLFQNGRPVVHGVLTVTGQIDAPNTNLPELGKEGTTCPAQDLVDVPFVDLVFARSAIALVGDADMQTKARGRQIESLQGITNLAGGSESGVALPPESVESSRVLEVRGKVGRRGERGETVELDTIRIGSKLLGCAGPELEALDPHEIEDRFWASPLWFVMDEQLPNPFSLGCSHTVSHGAKQVTSTRNVGKLVKINNHGEWSTLETIP